MNDYDARLEVGRQLARQLLHLEDYHHNRHLVPAEFGKAGVEVQVNLRSMVQQITWQFWVHNAALMEQIEAKVKEAASTATIERHIAEAVAVELSRVRADITRRVREHIERMVNDAIAEAVGKGPATLARKIAQKMWDKVFASVAPSRGDRYGRGPRKPR